MNLLLVHGMGRTPLSMRRLARALRADGHTVRQLGYSATLESVERIASRIRAELDAMTAEGRPLMVVGHSLGAVLLRLAMTLGPPMLHLPDHLVMLGPPNQPPRLARRLHRLWPYRLFNGDAGQRLADPEFLARLPAPPVPYTIIAGTGGRRGRWSPFGTELNDGLVAVSETHCHSQDIVIEVHARHTFLMNHPAVRAEIRKVIAALPS